MYATRRTSGSHNSGRSAARLCDVQPHHVALGLPACAAAAPLRVSPDLPLHGIELRVAGGALNSRAVELGTDPDRIAPADRIIHAAVASSLRIVDERLNELFPAIEEDRVRWPPDE